MFLTIDIGWLGGRSNAEILNRQWSTCRCWRGCLGTCPATGWKMLDSSSKLSSPAELYSHTQRPKASKFFRQSKDIEWRATETLLQPLLTSINYILKLVCDGRFTEWKCNKVELQWIVLVFYHSSDVMNGKNIATSFGKF